MWIVALYTPQSAKAYKALAKLHNILQALQKEHPHAFYVISGDFKRVSLTDIAPRFHQLSLMQPEATTAWTKFTAYRAFSLHHLRPSDYICNACPVLQTVKPTKETTTVWTDDAALFYCL